MIDKWIEILQAADYPQGSVTENDLRLMAKYYDPSYIQAPVISKHRMFNDKNELINNEAALSWIKALKVNGTSLYAQFENTADLKDIYDGIKYRYCSAEIQTETIKGEKVPYLGALAVTNFPASKVAPIILTGREPIRIYSTLLKIEKDNKMTPEQMKLICKKLGIDENSTPEQIVSKIKQMSEQFKDNENFTKAAEQIADVLKLVKAPEERKSDEPVLKAMEAKLEKLSSTVIILTSRLESTDEDRVEAVFNQELANRKFLPSQKEIYVGTKEKPGKFYKDASGLKKLADTLPPLSLSSTFKLPNYDGTNQPVTYGQILKDAKLYSQMRKENPEALETLRQEWLAAPENQIAKEEKKG